jgi:hypothetical protein
MGTMPATEAVKGSVHARVLADARALYLCLRFTYFGSDILQHVQIILCYSTAL